MHIYTCTCPQACLPSRNVLKHCKESEEGGEREREEERRGRKRGRDGSGKGKAVTSCACDIMPGWSLCGRKGCGYPKASPPKAMQTILAS